MSQQAAVTLNSVVYNPAGSQNGILYWYDRSGGVANSFSPLTQGFVQNSGARKLTKVTYRVSIPTVADADSACSCTGSVLRTSSFQLDFWIDPNESAAGRADLLARAVSLVGSALVSSAVSNLDPAYA